MKSVEVRTRFLEFFEARGHTLHRSAGLVPDNDSTLLFTGAGMNQFKDMFLGRGTLPFLRAATCQKCLRLPDLENVGRTPSHHTFFEMLGNFSFGDYFKREAIAWAHEFLVQELGLPPERLYYSVYVDDHEAARLWETEAGVAPDRVFRYGEEDNFWPAEAPSKGPNGPCGPCSEIYYDFTPGRPMPPGGPAADGKRFAEIWNLVFTQYERRDGGELVDLPRRNIDTGAGFERIVRVMQGGETNFDTDLFAPILGHVGEITGKSYGGDPDDTTRMRRIADHIRAATFCICEGVRPSNERQGYVVRKILRRAFVDWWTLGAKEVGIEVLVPTVVKVEGMGEQYPELRENQDRIARIVAEEEHRFSETYTHGAARLAEHLSELEQSGGKVLDGRKAFFLWDTAGFPLDLTRRILHDRGMDVDDRGFEQAMEEQRARARRGSKMDGKIFDEGPIAQLKGRVPASVFTGYTSLSERARLVAIVQGEGLAERATGGDEVALILDRTPFYAESGGQVGDRGAIRGETFRFAVSHTTAVDGYVVHHGEVLEGSVQAGGGVEAQVDGEQHRYPTMRNHTATHLLHWALRLAIGKECEQAGSMVAPDRLRFDFTAPRPLNAQDLRTLERLVNGRILEDQAVTIRTSSLEDAKATGAMALFGEKYGEEVRVVTVAASDEAKQSIELCGGTHCERTGQIGLFKILSEGSIAAGVRRIEAVTGLGALDFVETRLQTLEEAARTLKSDPASVPQRIEILQADLRRARKEIDKARRGDADQAFEHLRSSGRRIGDVTLFVKSLDGQDQKTLMALVDRLLKEQGAEPAGAILASSDGKKVSLVVGCNACLVERGVAAGEICHDLARSLGGGGGGHAGMARGQGLAGGDFEKATREVLLVLEKKLGAGEDS